VKVKCYVRAATSLALLLLAVAAAFAQGTREDYARAERFLQWNIRKLVFDADVTPRWMEGGERFWYRKLGRGGKEFLLVDAAKKTRAPAFDHARLAAALSKAASREYKPSGLPFDTFEFVQQNAAIRFDLENARWTCTLAAYECTREEVPPRQEGLSPDRRWQAFVRAFNLWIRSVANGQEIQLTRDGEKYYDYATRLPSVRLMIEQRTEDVRQSPAVFWSPDSQKLITYRIDSRNASRFTVTQYAPPDRLRPVSFSYAYPLPGEYLSKAEPMIFDVQSGRRIAVETQPLDIFFTGGPGFLWTRDSKRFRFTFFERAYKAVELREVDAATGAVRGLFSERSETFVDPGKFAVRYLLEGDELLVASERDGWNHLYLYDGKTAQLKNQVTKGNWAVRAVDRIDEKTRQVYFLASGREPNEDPYQAHLYRINFDGTDLRPLTPENANHGVSFSPSGAYFVDRYSRPDLPGVSVLRRGTDGEVLLELEKTDAELLLKTGWKFPEPFRGTARDAKTDIYGLIWRPTNFDPSKKYPVIEQIYTGPQSFFVPKTFAAYGNTAQAVAELGFIVVQVDGMGTSGRSKAFHNFSYKNLGDGGIDDHIALLRQMAARYPYLDLTRAGIYGTSAGGYDAAHAMLTHPDFYKVGVSISGNHDQRMDKAWWNELWMGYPVGEHYREQSNITLAPKLEGRLLLVHGDLDDNVNVSETLQFVNALIKANKDFDMLIVPNQYHGEGGNTYLVRRRWDYFVRNLLGVTPPAGYEIKRGETTAGN